LPQYKHSPACGDVVVLFNWTWCMAVAAVQAQPGMWWCGCAVQLNMVHGCCRSTSTARYVVMWWCCSIDYMTARSRILLTSWRLLRGSRNSWYFTRNCSSPRANPPPLVSILSQTNPILILPLHKHAMHPSSSVHTASSIGKDMFLSRGNFSR
jgi:hypothetical protein